MPARRALPRGLLLLRLVSRLRLRDGLLRHRLTLRRVRFGFYEILDGFSLFGLLRQLLPRARAPTPSTAWTRSRSPSTTRAMTRTVSPGRKSGTFGFCLSGTIDFRSMATLPSLLFALLKGKPLPLLRSQLRLRQKVRAPPRRQQQGLPPPPLRHLLVVAGEQHLRHRPAAELRWPRVV